MESKVLVNQMNHKGKPCIVHAMDRFLFCQEGYCKDCQVYIDWLKNARGSQK